MTSYTLAATDWSRLSGTFEKAIIDTCVMVAGTMLIGGLAGLFLGVLLYTTRSGGVLQNKGLYWFLNILVNFVRPIPFIILLITFGPLTQ